MACSRYIELNPVRARMVARAGDYTWSSHRRNAEGAYDPLVSEHALYGALGAAPAERRLAYRALFESALPDDLLETIRSATNRGWALGDEGFRSRMSRLLGRPAGPRPRGRPSKRTRSQ